MGNSSSRQKSHSTSQQELQQYFQIICNTSSTLEKKKQALDILRVAYVPDISWTPAYSQELSRVFALRYPRWDVQGGGVGNKNPGSVANSIRGVIFGAAVGDAAGLSTEFLSKSQIDSYFGNNFIFFPGCDVYPDVHRVSFTAGDWTDDTDQLILALIALLEGGGHMQVANFAALLNAWKENGFPGLGDTGGCGLGKSTKAVIVHRQFLTNPIQAAKEIWQKSGKNLAPNGALMRTAITAIPFYWDLSIVQENTLQLCISTHADPRCQASCLLLCLIIARILQYWAVTTTVEQPMPFPQILGILRTCYEEAEQVLVDSSFALQIFTQEDVVAIEETKSEFHSCGHAQALRGRSMADLQLDDGPSIGYTYKCLSAAILALMHVAELGYSFENTIQSIIREGGDSDTNAAVAGALLGAYLGIICIPTSWIRALPYEVWLDARVQKVLYMLHSPSI